MNTSPSEKIYNLIKDGKYQEALITAENEYSKDKKNIDLLVDYVKCLLEHRLYVKAEDILLESPNSPTSHPTTYFLLRELYTRTGSIDKIRELKQYQPEFHIPSEHSGVRDISSNNESLRPDKVYFKAQLLDLILILIKKYKEYNKIFKKIYTRIDNNLLQEGYYLLKEFAQSIDDEDLSYFLLAELALVDGKFSLAEKRYKKLLSTFNDQGLIYNRLGDIKLVHKNENAAEFYYAKAMEFNPDDLDTHMDLIRTYTLKNEMKKAKSSFNEAEVKFGKANVKHLKSYIKKIKVNRHKGRIIHGLVWHENGGNIMPIEISSIQPGSAKISATGNLGFVMLDSINLVEKVSLTSKYCFENSDEFKRDININIPESVIYKDGPSAGLALIVGVLSEYMNQEIPNNTAFTGELTLNGHIRGIGGLKEKLLGAYMHGITNIYIPKENFRELRLVQKSIKSTLSIHLVNHYEEVLDDLWMN